ncbi:PREDICTED: Fc receptor-like protein 2 [Odobenus rosmarus divergens]|uniref:Fc receptor-like protein 2 n=1 Tax=Odobenus rosmarus divergens TaxID=9708 RepID=A0A2U3X217_ODORO|nr:PREDICTED: Fc receptor-like protein 2 [Odobenus rosmarus divergens]
MLLWSLLVIFAPVSEEADWLTLQAPSVVFEGDSIDLMCQKEENWRKIQTISYYKDGKELQLSNNVSSFSIPRAALSDSGSYHCFATAKKFFFLKSEASRSIRIEVQELFPHPVLTVSPSWPTEGSPVTLTCETQLSPQRSNAQLRFCFFRDGRALGSGWSSSPELRVPAMWAEDSGSYWCQAETVIPRVRKQSLQSQIHVQRVPVSNVSLEMWAPRDPVIEGGDLILLCSVAEGTGNITFSWHREDTGTSVGRKTQRSLSAELEVPAVQEGDAGRYYCIADNGHDPIQSKLLSIRVRSPVSYPVLTLRAPRAWAVVGDMVELRCEAQRGSPPILYQFYHENVTLGNSSAPSGGGVSFNLSLTPEHSGNYSCEADNGLGAQRSEAVPLRVTGTGGYRRDHVTARFLGVLCGGLGFITTALLFYYWSHKISGGRSVTHAPRDASSTNPQEPTHSNSLSDMEEMEPEYVNVGPVDVDVVYSQVWSTQPPEDSANTRTILKNKDSHVIYSDVKENTRRN